MSTTVARRPRVKKAFQTLVREAEVYILCAPLSAPQLARDLGASVATTARVIAELRRTLKARGGELVSVRRGRRFHYEIREDRTRAWERFLRRVDGLKLHAQGPPIREEDQDAVIYGF
jgi:hypothetical protein